MFCFKHQHKSIIPEVRNHFIMTLEEVLNQLNGYYVYHKNRHTILINNDLEELIITMSDRQILIISEYDFEDGSSLTDLVIEKALAIFGSISVRIEY
ncbi:hypothetical protein [Guptibacillus hwajinpoensis]|uniref:Uncharacterized protein n=1 Tax=Guptibacillus hwajinpoensis TaxID=208199 RepID=A0A0J6D0R3_9BACL|nr:hypothetical protein [Alkalihalobacillus macyae]KMM37814.1 hypothetical protein AB986_00245 [Alkalihalobacillus macyae]